MSGRFRSTWGAVYALLLLALGSAVVRAQELEFHPPISPLDASAAAVMHDLAVRVLPVYEEKNPERFLRSLSAIQVVAGNYGPARASRDELRGRRREGESDRESGERRLLDIYVRALESAGAGRATFAQTFTQSFRDAVTPLQDLNAFAVTGWRPPELRSLEQGLQLSFDQRRSRNVIALADAVELLRRYFEFDAYRRFGKLHESLSTEDDQRRYLFDTVRVRGWNGVSIAVVVARPRNAPGTLPALLQFTLQRDAQQPVTGPAAHGYAGIVASKRIAGTGAPRVVPFQHDGEDARAVLRWIAKQGWSDGRVGMYGEGYSGFAAWAAAKGAPSQLKAIATSDPTAPGIDTPMSGNIFHNAAYRWVQQVAGSRGDEASLDDAAAWRALDETWYRSGRRYRDLERLNKRPNRYFQRWLNHPSYDRFWQKMIPFREQFASIKIPVLTLTGYFSPAQPSALYYFAQHQHYNAQADHTLLVGPYAQASGQVMGDRPGALLRRLPVDPVARIGLDDLRYQWFDHVLKGAARPTLLRDRVNFETMGANEWRHAPTLAGMSNATLRFYLDAKPVTGGHLLAQLDKPNASSVRWEVALRERETPAFTAAPDLLGKTPQTRHALTYTSEPLTASLDIAGVLAGQLDLTTNKQDIDVTVAMYEQQQSGDFVKLFDPSAAFRASYARDRTQRRLLKAGRLQHVPFSSERVTSRRIAAGSRLVVILGINKRPDQEINYGAGNDVSEESMADARLPLRVRWRSSSYIDVPVRR